MPLGLVEVILIGDVGRVSGRGAGTAGVRANVFEKGVSCAAGEMGVDMGNCGELVDEAEAEVEVEVSVVGAPLDTRTPLARVPALTTWAELVIADA